MIHNIMWVLAGAGVLAGVVVLWFVVYYLLSPSLKDPDGKAKITGKCGDTMELCLKFKDGRVARTSFWTDGCAYSYNSIAAVAELVKGKSPDEIIDIDANKIQEFIGGLPETHIHCAKLAEETLHTALNDYMVKATCTKHCSHCSTEHT